MSSALSMSSTDRGAGRASPDDGLDDIDYIDDVDDPPLQTARAAFGQSVRRPAASGEAASDRPMRAWRGEDTATPREVAKSGVYSGLVITIPECSPEFS